VASILTGLLNVSLFLSVVSALFLILNHLSVPRLRPALPEEGGSRIAGLVSICVPARNEERAIEVSIRSLLAQDDDAFEVVVIDDRSTDGTGRILLGLAGEDKRLTVLESSDPPPGWLGKPNALHLASQVAIGEWLLFVDADVRLHPRTLATVRRFFADEHLDFLTLFPHLELEGFGEKSVLTFLGDGVSFLGPSFLANASWFRSVNAGGGAFMMVSRSLYESIGGHEALRDAVVDDIRLGIAAKKGGGRCRTALAFDLVKIRMYHGFREIVRGFSKNLFAGLGRSWINVGGVGAVLSLQVLLPVGVLVAFFAGAPFEPGAIRRAALAYALVLGCRIVTDIRFERSLLFSVTLPLEVIAFIYMMFRSASDHRWHGGVEWRGRIYREGNEKK